MSKNQVTVQNPDVIAHIDGACKGNPGHGGWGVVMRHVSTDAVKHFAGAVPETTNNRAELLAAIHALKTLKKPGLTVQVVTDSRLLVDAWNKWLPGWQKNGWRKSNRKPVENVDLWQELLEAAKSYSVTFEWTEGHAGAPDNEQADHLASGAATYFAQTGNAGPWAKVVK